MQRRSVKVLARALTAAMAAAVLVVIGAAPTPGGAATASIVPTHGHIDVVAPDADHCDPIAGPKCLSPFPDDFYTVRDPRTDTRRRVAIDRRATPANAAGVHIDPIDQNRNDGFSPGSAIVVLLPGVDPARSGVNDVTNMAASLRANAPIVLLDATTGKRVPYWAELDANAPDDASRTLLVRPSINFGEGHRIIVAFRNLVNRSGVKMPVTNAFKAYRDRIGTGQPVLEKRRVAMEDVFNTLARAGIGRFDLQLAWDFTIASARSLSERLLHMRDDAFAALGSGAPPFTVTSVEERPSPDVLRIVNGTFQVPSYMTGDGSAGTQLNNGAGPDDSPLPARNGSVTANFICVVPKSALGILGAKANPTRGVIYGHGLLGDAGEVRGVGSTEAKITHTTYCATDEIGMSEGDVGNVIGILQDLSKFRTLADRLQQGLLNELFLARLMLNVHGLTTNAAFQDAAGRPLLDHTNMSYFGASQGGILGGALSAVAQDWHTVLLAVPAMNYSTLLNRSVDFDEFGAVLNPAYPNAADRQLDLELIQMLWDRGENNGYAEHLTSHPYEGTQAKHVLLFEAFGDHQVSNVATEVMARTIGAKVRTPAIAPGRSTDVTPMWGVPKIAASALPATGSFLVLWDFGTPAPPTTNLPNRGGSDPHGMGRGQLDIGVMGKVFLEQDRLIDVCHGGPCQTLPAA